MKKALRSRTILLLAGATFLSYFAIYSFAFWFPTMLKRQSGFSDMRVGLLGALPYLTTFVVMQINGWHSDKSRERHWHAAVPLFIAAAGLIGLVSHPQSIQLTLFFFTLVAVAIAYLPAFWAIPTEILSQSVAAAAVGMINAVGSVAGFAGPYLFGYLHTRTGTFSYGLAIMMVAAVAGGVLMLSAPRSAVAVEGPAIVKAS
jgi:cyanate permease